jgi:hypothetical protein
LHVVDPSSALGTARVRILRDDDGIGRNRVIVWWVGRRAI